MTPVTPQSPYVDTFFRELSPAWINHVAAFGGAAVVPLSQPFSYLELGCGFGHSSVVHAAAFPHATFHACDVNPQHVEGLRQGMRIYGVTNLQAHACSFEALLSTDIGSMDLVVAHGVYSWVDAPARATLLRVVDRALRPGGLLYLSYNCLPGWNAEQPVRRLLMELAAAHQGDELQRAGHALQQLLTLPPSALRFFGVTPEARDALTIYARQPIHYLVHEIFSPAWDAFYSVDVARELAALGLRFVGSATLTDNHPALTLDKAALDAVASLPPSTHALAADFAAHRRFRRDVYARAAGPLPPQDVAQFIQSQVVGCVDPARLANPVRVPRGDLTLAPAFLDAVRAALQDGPRTMGALVDALGGPGRDPAAIARNLGTLVAAEVLTPFAQPTPGARPTEATLRTLLQHILDVDRPRAIPSAMLGGGVEVTPTDARALLAHLGGSGGAAPGPVLVRLQRAGAWV